MWQELAIALCLMLVLEGMLPFLNPQSWRNMVLSVAQLTDQQLRVGGFVLMLLGVASLYGVRG
ncbi:DUF2065 domain-containing protein [Atopomonas sediminilitoris]|uniref:DUF2065 domain-containing protein n=1 Tax=Atopomonas sediminilitoris TaxID=2919919 RepID=UPI001F4EAE56|nr:DUF2065 family protein [Atopomonas sediminilitoris]MCJ8170243.1 DUF2065 domain-containing protein [Atopomonas sediminilitoris]